jgi:holo-[acyl-carrier protein] synthase
MKDKVEKTVIEALADREFAVGNDLVFLPNFKKSLTAEFKNKVYTPNEVDITLCFYLGS